MSTTTTTSTTPTGTGNAWSYGDVVNASPTGPRGGFIGAVDLTPDGARELAYQLTIAADDAEDSRPVVFFDVHLESDDRGHYHRAIRATNEQDAIARAIRLRERQDPDARIVRVEQSRV